MTEQVSVRTLKRLTAAEGYLELDLPDLALEELGGIQQPGPYLAVIDWLTGEALKEKQEFDAAIDSLSRAIPGIPSPHNRRAIEALSECFRETGRDELAQVADIFALKSAGVDVEEEELPAPQFQFPMLPTGLGRMSEDAEMPEEPDSFESNN